MLNPPFVPQKENGSIDFIMSKLSLMCPFAAKHHERVNDSHGPFMRLYEGQMTKRQDITWFIIPSRPPKVKFLI